MNDTELQWRNVQIKRRSKSYPAQKAHIAGFTLCLTYTPQQNENKPWSLDLWCYGKFCAGWWAESEEKAKKDALDCVVIYWKDVRLEIEKCRK